MDEQCHRATSREFGPTEADARRLDAADSIAAFREQFHIPRRPGGDEVIYFAGNSLGLQPKGVAEALRAELDDWARLGVEAHFQGTTPWYSYHETLRETGARLVGAQPGEVVAMNSLTVNLHLMMITFYRPTRDRFKIVMEDTAFPSDTYAIKSQIRHHGLDPREALMVIKPRQGEHVLRTEDIVELLQREGERIAVVMMSGVNYFSGQVFDMEMITREGRSRGCIVGWDLAHAAGNVELRLHDWNADFAAWCNYKYLNSGPGAVAGCFVHERHGRNAELPRLAGWWGNDPATRFQMHQLDEFIPRTGADGWQISNPPILAMTPVRISYDLFDRATMASLRAKSVRLTGYLQYLLDQLAAKGFDVITPREPEARGCQLSILAHHRPRELLQALHAQGVVCDFREPNVIRLAPVPLYNTFLDVWRFVNTMASFES